MKVWVVIPAYNDANTLQVLLKDLKDEDLSTLVIDDGSQDATFSAARNFADVVIKNERNFGKGVALRRGIDYLLQKNEFDYIITMDADGQHSPLDLKEFIKEARRGEYFIVGNRMDNPRDMSKLRVVTNRFMSWLISRIIGQRVPDSQCGFRLIKKDVLEKIHIKAKKFEIDSEILIQAARCGFPIKSIPIKSIYRQNQPSRIRPFIDALRFIRFIVGLKSG